MHDVIKDVRAIQSCSNHVIITWRGSSVIVSASKKHTISYPSLQWSQARRFGIRRLIGQPQARGHMHDEANRIAVFDLCDPHTINITLWARVTLFLWRERQIAWVLPLLCQLLSSVQFGQSQSVILWACFKCYWDEIDSRTAGFATFRLVAAEEG